MNLLLYFFIHTYWGCSFGTTRGHFGAQLQFRFRGQSNSSGTFQAMTEDPPPSCWETQLDLWGYGGLRTDFRFERITAESRSVSIWGRGRSKTNGGCCTTFCRNLKKKKESFAIFLWNFLPAFVEEHTRRRSSRNIITFLVKVTRILPWFY